MNLFDMSGYDVKIHIDMLAIPEYNKLWNERKNKDEALNILKYVIFNNHPLSVYVKSYTTKDRTAMLKKEFLEHLDIDELYLNSLEVVFNNLHDSLEIKLIRKLRKIIEDFIDDLDAGKIGLEEAVKLGPKAEQLIKSIGELEKSIKLEMSKKTGLKGGYKLGILEKRRGS